MATAAAARAGAAAQNQGREPENLDPNILLAQAGPPRPPRPPRMPGGMLPRTMQEEALELRFTGAIRRIQKVEPHNRELQYMRDPARAPSEPTVLRMEEEAHAAEARSRGESGTGPLLADVLRPPEPYRSTLDIMAPGGYSQEYVKVVHARAQRQLTRTRLISLSGRCL